MLAAGLVVAILIWLLLSAATGVYAARLSRTGVGWFFLALILSPLIAAVFLLALGHHEPLHCPYCAEPIREEAIRCPHCRSEVGEDDVQRPHPLDRRWDDRRR
jgi:hypothetical protein